MWFTIGLILGAFCGFCWPAYALREVCIEFEELSQQLYDLEARELSRQLQQRCSIDRRKVARRLPEPSRN
jgi:hypothetical protein